MADNPALGAILFLGLGAAAGYGLYQFVLKDMIASARVRAYRGGGYYSRYGPAARSYFAAPYRTGRTYSRDLIQNRAYRGQPTSAYEDSWGGAGSFANKITVA